MKNLPRTGKCFLIAAGVKAGVDVTAGEVNLGLGGIAGTPAIGEGEGATSAAGVVIDSCMQYPHKLMYIVRQSLK